jgi:hypothetical protein
MGALACMHGENAAVPRESSLAQAFWNGKCYVFEHADGRLLMAVKKRGKE